MSSAAVLVRSKRYERVHSSRCLLSYSTYRKGLRPRPGLLAASAFVFLRCFTGGAAEVENYTPLFRFVLSFFLFFLSSVSSWLVGWLNCLGCICRLIVDRMVGWLVLWLADWSCCWLVGSVGGVGYAGCLAGWLSVCFCGRRCFVGWLP